MSKVISKQKDQPTVMRNGTDEDKLKKLQGELKKAKS